MINDKIVYSKEFVYFLGFLWSDGFIERKRTILEIVEDDALDIINDIKKIDFLNVCTMRRSRKGRKPQMSIYFCNVNFFETFQSIYFQNKSVNSPCKLIADLPDEFVRYFYLGLIDGDGCFYMKNTTKQFYVTSSYEQNWQHIVSLFDKIGIKQYEIRRIIVKNGNKSSYIRIKKYNEIKRLYEYLYPNGIEIGLRRKYKKCKEIIDNQPKHESNKSKIEKELLISKIQSGKNILDISKDFECSWRKIYNFCKSNQIKYNKGFFKGVI